MYLRRHLVPGLGHYRLDRLTPTAVQGFVDSKLAEGLSPQTVLHLRGLLRLALNRAVKFGLVGRNVVLLTDPPKMKRKAVDFFTPEQARLFLAAAEDDPLEGLYVLALTTGLRQGELLGLRWVDVDLEKGELRVLHQLQRVGGRLQLVEPKTLRTRRSTNLPHIAVSGLRAHRAAERVRLGPKWKDDGLVFTTSRGTPFEGRNVVRSFKRLLVKAGLPEVRFHDLRHSFASLLLAQGVPLRVVMEMLGHSTIRLTADTYSHVMPAAQRDAANQLEALLLG